MKCKSSYAHGGSINLLEVLRKDWNVSEGVNAVEENHKVDESVILPCGDCSNDRDVHN